MVRDRSSTARGDLATRLSRAAVVILAGGGLLCVSACTGVPSVSLNQVTPPPRPHELAEAIAGRDVPVAVTTSPFAGVTPLQLAAIVAGDMPSLCMAHYHPVETVPASGITWSFSPIGAAGSAPGVHGD